MISWCRLLRQSQHYHHSCLLELRMSCASLAFLSQHFLEMLSVIIAASLALKSPPDQRHLLYNEGTCWREKLDIPLLKQASFTMKSPCEAALLNLLYAQHVYGLCSSCRNPGSLNSKAIWGFSQPKREIGTACAQEHHPSPLPRPPDFVHPTIPPLGKYLASKIWNFMIF